MLKLHAEYMWQLVEFVGLRRIVLFEGESVCGCAPRPDTIERIAAPPSTATDNTNVFARHQ